MSIDREMLRDKSFEIAEGIELAQEVPIGATLENDCFVGMPVIPLVLADAVTPVSVTNLYTVPGQGDPKLYKKYFPHPELDLVEAAKTRQACVDLILSQMPFLPNSSANRFVGRAREAIKATQDETEPDMQFQTLAVLAIFSSYGVVSAYNFTSRSFLEKLNATMPELETVRNPEEDAGIVEILKEEYAMQAEHNPDLPPEDEWIEMHKRLIDQFATSKDTRDFAMQWDVNMLLLPKRDTHSTIQAQLFK